VTVRELNGWSPKTVTLDVDGNLLSVSATEPRFTKEQVALLLASRRAESAPRGDHGLLLSETTDLANQFAYKVPDPIKDWAQVAVDKKRAEWMKSHPETSGWLFRVERR